MHLPAQKKLALAFWLLALLDIAGIAAGITALHFIAKPLLVPALFMSLLASPSTVPGKKLLLTGLFFSWMGDVFLLFEYKYALFFILGLASFLTTHVFYIIYFVRIRSLHVSLLKKQPLLIILVLAYGGSLVWLLYPHLGDLTVPVVIYAAVICTMLLCSLHVFLKVNPKPALSYLLGAGCFVLSDSLLAIDKFYTPFACAGVCIMLTYCAAQYFIVRGYTEQTDHDQS